MKNWLEMMLKIQLGGISFLSRRHGWAFDNVQNYEVRSILQMKHSPNGSDPSRPADRDG